MTTDGAGPLGVVGDVQEAFKGYLAANRSGAARDVVVFTTTPMVVAAGGATTVLQTEDEVEAWYAGVMRRLAGLSYARTEVHRLEVEVVDEHTAVVQMTGVRLDSDGDAIEPIGAFYVFNRVGSAWRISVLTPTVLTQG